MGPERVLIMQQTATSFAVLGVLILPPLPFGTVSDAWYSCPSINWERNDGDNAGTKSEEDSHGIGRAYGGGGLEWQPDPGQWHRDRGQRRGGAASRNLRRAHRKPGWQDQPRGADRRGARDLFRDGDGEQPQQGWHPARTVDRDRHLYTGPRRVRPEDHDDGSACSRPRAGH